MKVIVFDIWGDYAHFRRFYTTTSPITFSLPPPPTVLGMIGSIIGLRRENNEYLKILNPQSTAVGIQILKPIKKIRLGINLINTKNNIFWLKERREGARTPTRFEFLKEPAYRIYFHHKDEQLMLKLKEHLSEHKSFFTPCLGLSELLADFRFVGHLSAEEKSDEFGEILTAIAVSNLSDGGIKLEEGKRYFKETLPLSMDGERKVLLYEDVVFEGDGKSIKAKLKRFFQLENGEAFCFL
jgi:CRISPR-associated protein Cas5h